MNRIKFIEYMNCSPRYMSSSKISPHNEQLFAPAHSACLTYSAFQFVIVPWMCSLHTVVFEICLVGLIKLSVVVLCILLVGFIVVWWRWSSVSCMSGHCFHNQFSAASSAQTALPSPIVQNKGTSDVYVVLLFPSHHCQTHVIIPGTFSDSAE